MSSPPGRGPSTVGVGLILVRDDGRILLGHRIRAPERSWCLPGGHVEPGEDFETAALRELAEETGIEGAREVAVVGIALDLHRGGVRVTAGAVASATSVVPRNREPEVFEQWIWASPSDLPMPLFPASEALLAAWRGHPLPPGWTWYPASPASPTQRLRAEPR